MQCLVLAGGLGMRMRPITENIPKALIEVSGYPFVHHQLKLLKKMGFTNVVFAIGYKGNMLRDYLRDKDYEINIQYVDEGDTLRGTAGAIRNAIDYLDSKFFVLYGDSYLPIEIGPLWEFSGYGKYPTMTVLKNEGKWDSSNVIFTNKKMFYNKFVKSPEMEYIDYGLSILTKSIILSYVPKDTVMDLAILFHKLSLEEKLKGFEVFERFYECGSPDGVRYLEDYLKEI